MQNEKTIFYIDLAIRALLILAIEFILVGLVDISNMIFGYSASLSSIAALLSMFVIMPSTIIVVPVAILLSFVVLDRHLLILTCLFFLALYPLFAHLRIAHVDLRIANLLFAAPYIYTSIKFALKWFSMH